MPHRINLETAVGRAQTHQRVRSGLTQVVRAIEGDESSIHAEFHEVISGQLRFLGSTRRQLSGLGKPSHMLAQ